MQEEEKQLPGSKFVDALQEQFSMINEYLYICHQKMDCLTGPIPTSISEEKLKDLTAFNQALTFVLKIKDSVQCLADRMKDL